MSDTISPSPTARDISALATAALMMEHGVLEPDRINHDKMKMGGMMHKDPNSVLLEPGKSAEIIWTFPKAKTKLEFACNVPGHYEAGMVGPVHIGGHGH